VMRPAPGLGLVPAGHELGQDRRSVGGGRADVRSDCPSSAGSGGQASLAAAVFFAFLAVELRGRLAAVAGSPRDRRRRTVEAAPTLSEKVCSGNAARISRRPPRAST